MTLVAIDTSVPDWAPLTHATSGIALRSSSKTALRAAQLAPVHVDCNCRGSPQYGWHGGCGNNDARWYLQSLCMDGFGVSSIPMASSTVPSSVQCLTVCRRRQSAKLCRRALCAAVRAVQHTLDSRSAGHSRRD